jgi:hypothetical protein
MEQYSVLTTPQPPYAFVARIAARVCGNTKPMPLQWGTW